MVSLFLAAMLQWATVLVVCPSLPNSSIMMPMMSTTTARSPYFSPARSSNRPLNPSFSPNRPWSRSLSNKVRIHDRAYLFF
jgi:hypothetical protein